VDGIVQRGVSFWNIAAYLPDAFCPDLPDSPFISDTDKLSGTHQQNRNHVTYIGNNPIKFIDPNETMFYACHQFL
jgi:hypothetical protein